MRKAAVPCSHLIFNSVTLNKSFYDKVTIMDRNELPKEIRKIAADSGYEYIRTKAIRFLEVGADKYREKDALKRPSVTLSKKELELLMSGCRQVAEYKGLTEETAFEEFGVAGFYRLIELFHYTVIGQEVSRKGRQWLLDKMQVEHIMTGQKMVLYNKVKSNE